MEDFISYFQPKQADTGQFSSDSGSPQICVAPADKGVILENLKPWYTLELSSTLNIISGKENLLPFTNELPSESFLDFLDEKEQADFIKVILNLRVIKSDQSPSSTFDEMWQCVTDKNIGTWSGEMINRKKNGNEVAVLLTTNAIFDSTGTVVGYIGQHHDITRRKKHEEALQKRDIELERKNRELEKLNQLKSDMMAITSHDLKSPTAAMVGYADLVKSYMDQIPKEKIMRYLNGIVDAGHNQLKFIDDLLDVYKFESDAFIIEKKPIRLDYLLSGSVEINAMAGKTEQVTIRLVIEDSGGIVRADGVRMQQVFNNLLSNAIKYSPKESQIDVHYREIDGEKVQITIDDQGPGVFEADLDRIFDRYYQSKSKGGASERLHGVGMGLYISKHIVNFHDGTLQVKNLPNCGCRFTMEMPLTMPVQNEDQEKASNIS